MSFCYTHNMEGFLKTLCTDVKFLGVSLSSDVWLSVNNSVKSDLFKNRTNQVTSLSRLLLLCLCDACVWSMSLWLTANTHMHTAGKQERIKSNITALSLQSCVKVWVFFYVLEPDNLEHFYSRIHWFLCFESLLCLKCYWQKVTVNSCTFCLKG